MRVGFCSLSGLEGLLRLLQFINHVMAYGKGIFRGTVESALAQIISEKAPTERARTS